MEPFDTVSDTEEWLDEEPSRSEAEALLEAERDGPDRTTATRKIQSYLDGLPEEDQTEVDESDTEAPGVTFRVERSFAEYEVGEIIELDPNDGQTESWRKDGRIRRW